jgi:hypothetical protein
MHAIGVSNVTNRCENMTNLLRGWLYTKLQITTNISEEHVSQSMLVSEALLILSNKPSAICPSTTHAMLTGQQHLNLYAMNRISKLTASAEEKELVGEK